MIGTTLGHYRIEEQIGAGGMGGVYRARDTKLERDVALKLLPGDAAAGEAGAKRLLAEARAASALNHPNVATVYEVGEAEGRGYIAMELVAGRTLSECIPADGMPAELVVRYGTQIAAALAHAHDRGVVHRDLKSANVRITPDGQAKVLDFGLAARAKSKEIEEATASLDARGAAPVGTPHYMAPEVLRGEPIDARSDIWALGVVLQEMATGKRPFGGSSASELIVGIMREPPAPLPANVPTGLRAVIQRCLAKEPGQRYQRASEVHAALDAISSHAVTPASVQVPAALVTARPWWRRKMLWGMLTAAAVLGLAFWKGPFVISIGKSEPDVRSFSPPLMSGPASPNAEANEYLERAWLFMGPTVDIPRAQQLLQRALALDPKFATARAAYGLTFLILVHEGWSNDVGLIYRAEKETRQALADSPDMAGGHNILGAVYVYLNRDDLARQEFDRTFALDPYNQGATLWLTFLELRSGRYDRAVELCRKNLLRGPTFSPARFTLAQAFMEQGRAAEARHELEKMLEHEPKGMMSLIMLARLTADAGDLAKARSILDQARPETRQNYRMRLARALLNAREGRGKEAVGELDSEVLKYAEVGLYAALTAAEVYALAGQADQSLDWLDRAVRSGDERAEWFQRDPLLANIRSHPRFKQILDSLAFRRQQRAR